MNQFVSDSNSDKSDKMNQLDTLRDDGQLDPETSGFVPLRAIYDPQFRTDTDTECHDNVEKCVAVIEGRVRAVKPKPDASKVQNLEVKLERQFLASQLPVEGKPRKQFRHAVTRMGEFNSGPLSVLKKCMEAGEKVRVWTRGRDRVRGVATGFIVAFDKHWNLALTDVDEQFSRRRSRKAPVLGGEITKDVPSDNRNYKIGESSVRVLKVNKKDELCTRHVPQVLLRGEHVVMVASCQ